MKHEGRSEEVRGRTRVGDIKEESTTGGTNSPRSPTMKSSSSSPAKSMKSDMSPKIEVDKLEVVGGAITVKQEPGKPPKLSRSSSQKIISRPAQIFDDYPDDTDVAKSTFQVIPECLYSNKSIGSTEHAMDCDCADEWDASTKVNLACGEDSDCINRATKMECFGDCGCGPDCQNQRFQQNRFASVTVIKTEKKGYGLRADTDLQPNEFIFEYIGEVIGEGQFRRRMVQYDEEGIKHFYFMSLTKGEFVDATKKGNLGRFCNHSCNPNCYVDKWVVGDKLRMGIFAERNIKSGEELVFNYNVDRYGADPQPCYCGEPNCTGFIGGKTQTERATKLSNLTIEALGIDDGDGWDTAVAKKSRKKKTGEDDEEYVNNVQPKSLDEDGVTKVMATLMQCKEKWIAVKLLGRIQHCDDERVRNRVVKMHGYQILNSTLSLWKEDPNVVLQVLDILKQFPRLTRNKISDSKIESTVEGLKDCGHERVESQAQTLLMEWSTLEVAYRIPRRKREVNSNATPDKPDRLARRDSTHRDRKARSKSRSRSRSRARSKSIEAPRGPAALNGSRGNVPQRNNMFYSAPRPPYRPRPYNALPPGWSSALDGTRPYYFNVSGFVTWDRPTMPATQAQAPPPPPKAVPGNKALEDIINSITNNKANTPKGTASASTTPQLISSESKKDRKGGKEKWRTYSEEKQKKIYENTLFPHIKHVVDKFKTKLPKDDLKRLAKDLSKKLVNSDFKNHRVEDPSRVSSKQEKNVKKYVKDYFDKAVVKQIEYNKKKAQLRVERGEKEVSPSAPVESLVKMEADSDQEQGVELSDDYPEKEGKDSATPATPIDQIGNSEGLKRKRGDDSDINGVNQKDDEVTPSKRPRSATPPPPPPPTPPPPPMADGSPTSQATSSKLTAGVEDVTMGEAESREHADFQQVSSGVTAAACRTPIKDLMIDDANEAQPPGDFDMIQNRDSVVTDISDNAPSPSLLNASDLTPMESDSEREGERGRSFTGANLQRVQQLQVYDGV